MKKTPQDGEIIKVKSDPRNKLIMVRCTEPHYELLKKAAAKAGFKLSTWVCHAAVNFSAEHSKKP